MTTKGGPVAQNGHKHLTRDELLAQLGEKRADFMLPGGGVVTLKSIDVSSGMEFFGGGTTDGGEVGDRIKKICLLGIAEPKLSLEDLEALGQARMGVLDKIALKIMELSGSVGDEAASFLTLVQPPKESSSTA